MRGSAAVRSLGLALALTVVWLPVRTAQAADSAPVLRSDVEALVDTTSPPATCAQGADVNGLEGCGQPDTVAEPVVAVNPANGDNAVVVGQQHRWVDGGSASIGVSTTHDGGATWAMGTLPMPVEPSTGAPYPLTSDPTAAFGPDGWVYVTGDALDHDTGDTGITLWASNDGGTTWRAPVLVSRDMASFDIVDNADKSGLTVDMEGGPGHHPGRVYVVWYRLGGGTIFAAYSDDHGATWPTAQTGVVSPGAGWDPTPVVLGSGALAVFSNDLDHDAAASVSGQLPGQINATRGVIVERVAPTALGGPLVFDAPRVVSSWSFSPLEGQRSVPTMSAAVDHNTGRVALAWADSGARSDGRNDVVTAFSDEAGQSFGPAQRVNPDGSGPLQHWLANIAVAGDGRVVVSYRTQEVVPGSPAQNSTVAGVAVQVAPALGSAFGPVLSFAAPNADLGFAAVATSLALGTPPVPFLGDYEGLAVAGRQAYVVHPEAVRVSATEPSSQPPAFHHQRARVAVVDLG